ncbi:MAG TPA: hypothetical protein VNO55_03655 [Polyangia bacterium]|nr:hypothetical protein [Polyangia bacterium]
MLRRWSLVIGLSLVIHVLVVGGAVGIALLLGIPFGRPIDVEITGMSLEDVKDLPLGAPPGGERANADKPAPRPPAQTPKPADGAGELSTGNEGKRRRSHGDDVDAPEGPEPAPRASDLRQYGPEGSRVTALIRVDRLRATPYGPAVDEILMHLPDRRDLIDGTGLDFYKDFDALLIATPNPLDYTVTFLAARHHLTDGQLKAALDRGARATNRVLTWRTEARRPVAERRAKVPAPGLTRDQRIVVLPAPGLAVVTPPVYRSMLLRPPRPRPALAPDGGAQGGSDGGDGRDQVSTAAAATGTTALGPPEGDGWRALLRRIDAEDSILPANAIAMLNAVDIFSARSIRRGLAAIPSGGNAANGVGEGASGGATIYGLPVPRVITVVLGADPAPFADVKAELPSEAAAERWEMEWPAFRRKLSVNPYLVLTGFVPLVNRLEVEREGAVIHLHETATEAETLRLLQLIARFMPL